MSFKDAIKKSKRYFVDNKKIFDKKLFVYLVFVIISSVFWIFNQLDQEYVTKISFPIRFSNIPENKIIVNDLPSKLELKVKSQGMKLIEYKITNSFLPYTINLNSLSLRMIDNEKSFNFFVLTSTIKNNLEKHFDINIEILSISPDTLYFNFDEKVKKKVPVLSQIQVELKKQYLIKEKIKFTPDSINISGPGQIIDTINNVFSKKRQYYEAEKTIQDEILLKKINGVSLSNNSVNFSLIIEEFTEGNIKVPLRVINMPDSVILRTFPNENTISFLVALSDFDKIIEPQFDAVVDYDEIAGKSKLKVHLLKYPDNIYSVKTKPEYVEYIIEK